MESILQHSRHNVFFMKRLYLLFLLSLFVLASCDSVKENEACLLSDIRLESAEKVSKLTDMFNSYKIVRLETNDSCLIGDRMNKIIKRDSVYYIKNFDEIFIFDNNGTFMNKLSKRGNGPDEYTGIMDFDIVPSKRGNEIWIGSDHSIIRYDAMNLELLGHIELDNFPNRLYYVNDSTIITSGPGNKWLSVCRYDGKVRDRFFEEDQANGMYKITQFDRVGDKVTYQIDDTNEAAVYDPATDSYSFMNVFPDLKGVKDRQTNRDYYEKFGYLDFGGEVAKDYDALVFFRSSGDEILAQVRKPSKECILIASNGKVSKTLEYDMLKDTGMNDIIRYDGAAFLSTPIATDSDNGFIFILESDKINEGSGESNPMLLDVSSLF